MKVYGYEVTEEQIEALFQDVVKMDSSFRLHNVETLIRYGVLNGAQVAVQNRLADRLLQRWRKEGKIKFVFDYWVVCKDGQ